MSGFLDKFKSRGKGIPYDPSTQEPVIHKSICTGETTVGLVDLATGKYHDLRKVTGEEEIEKFCSETGIERDKIRTIW